MPRGKASPSLQQPIMGVTSSTGEICFLASGESMHGMENGSGMNYAAAGFFCGNGYDRPENSPIIQPYTSQEACCTTDGTGRLEYIEVSGTLNLSRCAYP